ncbi:MAG: hypothetical protein HY958_01285 [Bacteroidia bacterium]|nr:hypothetical protein [Bacteroidia bacterium]
MSIYTNDIYQYFVKNTGNALFTLKRRPAKIRKGCRGGMGVFTYHLAAQFFQCLLYSIYHLH